MREDLIEDLESVVRLLNDYGWDADVAVVREAIAALEAMPAWVKCEERMPAIGSSKTVWAVSDDGKKFQTSGNLCSEGWEMMHNASEYRSERSLFEDYGMKVTHWLDGELPAPPIQQEG